MTYEDFDIIVGYMQTIMGDTLKSKAGEYADGKDRLAQFKIGAALKQESPVSTLCGMWVKHITSIFMMEKHYQDYSLDQWIEKLKDNICYSVLMYALVKELKGKPPQVECVAKGNDQIIWSHTS